MCPLVGDWDRWEHLGLYVGPRGVFVAVRQVGRQRYDG